MLAIARTLMGNPALLLLDEPSEGLAPIIVQRIGELLRQLRGTGATVLIAEQNMHFCLPRQPRHRHRQGPDRPYRDD
jgi:branched-chain amino acid transport system ATP-binding protein